MVHEPSFQPPQVKAGAPSIATRPLLLKVSTSRLSRYPNVYSQRQQFNPACFLLSVTILIYMFLFCSLFLTVQESRACNLWNILVSVLFIARSCILCVSCRLAAKSQGLIRLQFKGLARGCDVEFLHGRHCSGCQWSWQLLMPNGQIQSSLGG